MTPDQVYEENKEAIKGKNGVTHLLSRQDKSELETWELCRHEILHIVKEFESTINLRTIGASIKK